MDSMGKEGDEYREQKNANAYRKNRDKDWYSAEQEEGQEFMYERYGGEMVGADHAGCTAVRRSVPSDVPYGFVI